MKHWYYADEARQPQGPVDAATLRDLLADGRISHATLIWRDGLSQWQAAADFAGELELEIAPPSVAVHPGSPDVPATAGDVDTTSPSSAADAIGAPALAPATSFDAPPPDTSPYAAPQAAVDMAPHVIQGGEIVYAGFWKRVAAFIIDNFLLVIINTVVGTILGIAMFGLVLGNNNNVDSPLMFVLQGLSYLAQLGISAVYFAWFHASTHQATPGKMAIGIKVVDRNGATISFWRGIGRYFAAFISTLLLLIGYLMVAFTGRKQALHDLICGTLVVDKWAYTHYPERQRPELGTVTWVVLILGGLLALLGLLATGALIAALGGGFGR